ncbi:hypothetical protein OPQ81_006798 [Rhizoctonia solani]|nr:hypothetical protein OPQ81_006798 [Rhizoctonia solani]
MQHTLAIPSPTVQFPHQPFQFNATLASPLFNIFPLASDDRLGWTPICSTPDCLPTASWSTRLVNSTLDFSYWGRGVALNGRVEGNMTIQLSRDGQQEQWNPSEGTLFTIKGSPLDQFYLHNVTLKIIKSSPDARLMVSKARINGSSLADESYHHDRWTLASNDQAVKYTGFTERPSLAGSGSPTTYVSTTAGDTVSMQWNGSAILLYGPCGPSSGLMRVRIDEYEQTLNLSRIENLGGGFLALDCMEFIRVSLYRPPRSLSLAVYYTC